MQAEVRSCKTCGTVRPVGEFYRRSDGHLSLHCKPCERERSRREGLQYRAAKGSTRRHKTMDTHIVDGEPGGECSRCHRVLPRSAFYSHPKAPSGRHGRCKECIAEQRRENPTSSRLACARRRARMKAAEGDLTTGEWLVICDEWDQCCAYCGDRPKVLTVDHVMPLSRDGSHSAENVVPACKPCNQRKHARTADEYLALEVTI